MIQLYTFGTADIRGDDHAAIHSFLAGPKRLAFLTFLALARPRGYHRRDTLLAMFWPESDQTHARGSLRGLLYQIRRTVGDDVVINRGVEEIGVAEGALRCDAIEFESACKDGRFREALELYRGDLMEGFFVPDAAPKFEHWLENERARFKQMAVDAAWALAEEELSSENSGGVAYWGRRAVALTPCDEAASQRLITLLDDVGNRAGALKAYDDLVKRLYDEFGIAPSEETQRLADRIRARKCALYEEHDEKRTHAGEKADHRSHAAKPAMAPVTESGRPIRRWKTGGYAGLGIAVAVVLVALVLISLPSDQKTDITDERAIAVLPFRVTGANASVSYLREGMVDLLSTSLTGDSGPRVLDPAAVLNRLSDRSLDLPRERALQVAEEAGAAHALVGSVVGTAERIVIDAALVSTRGGQTQAEARVVGAADDLPALVDELTATLLSLEAGEERHRISTLASTSLPALKKYLEGQSHFRGGRFDAGRRAFEEALDTDSTFALAAVALIQAQAWTISLDFSRGERIAWANRDRLASSDRAFLEAWLGPRYPDATPAREQIEAWERAVEVAPDRADHLFGLADRYFHYGRWIGLDDWAERARDGFERALALDSTHGPSLVHYLHLILRNGEADRADKYLERLDGQDGASRTTLQWYQAAVREDAEVISAIQSQLETMNTLTLMWISETLDMDGYGFEGAEQAAEILSLRSPSRSESAEVYQALHHWQMNRGRPTAAVETLGKLESVDTWPEHRVHHIRIIDALYAGGYADAARRSAQMLDEVVEREPSDASDALSIGLDVCGLELWRLHEGQLETAPAAVDRIQRLSRFEELATSDATYLAECALMLETAYAAETGRRDPARRASELESVMLAGPDLPMSRGMEFRRVANLVLAGAWEKLGEPQRALEAVRRRPFWLPNSAFLEAAFLKQEGRLAAETGDTTTAAKAYRHLMLLRNNAEPGSMPEVAAAHAALIRLEPPTAPAGTSRR